MYVFFFSTIKVLGYQILNVNFYVTDMSLIFEVVFDWEKIFIRLFSIENSLNILRDLRKQSSSRVLEMEPTLVTFQILNR